MKKVFLATSFVIGICFLILGVFFNPSLADLFRFFDGETAKNTYLPAPNQETFIAAKTNNIDASSCNILAFINRKISHYLEREYHFNTPLEVQLAQSSFSKFSQQMLSGRYKKGVCNTFKGEEFECYRWQMPSSWRAFTDADEISRSTPALNELCLSELKLIDDVLFEYITAEEFTVEDAHSFDKSRVELIYHDNQIVDFKYRSFGEIVNEYRGD